MPVAPPQNFLWEASPMGCALWGQVSPPGVARALIISQAPGLLKASAVQEFKVRAKGGILA